MGSLRLMAWFAAIVPASLLGLNAHAQELSKVTIAQQHAVVSVGEEVFFYAVPKRLGYFREEGLDVVLQSVANAGVAAQGLQNGAAEFATTQPEAIMKLREQGGDLIGIYALRHGNGSKVAILPESPIAQLEDMKGKTIGGLSWGAGGAPVLMRMLSDAGIDADSYRRVTVGAGPAALTALMNKQIDALVLWDSIFASFENGGAKLRYVEMPIQRKMGALTIATTERFAKQNPSKVEGFCRAVSKGLHFTRTNIAAAIRIFLDEFPSLKTPGVEASKLVANGVHILDTWLNAALWDVPYGEPTGTIPPGTWKFSQDFYVAAKSLQGTASSEDAYTNRYIAACNQFDRAAVAAEAKRYPN